MILLTYTFIKKNEMAKKKKQLPDLSKHDVLTPIDVSQLGTNGDPCFGIGYDL